jgi:transcriptional regulator with XRE-family HTH domain
VLQYAFGQRMFTLRTSIKLTQTAVAERLGVSRQTVVEWEAGSSYPKADHLKPFIELGIQRQAFAAGHEAEEILELWQASHQKVLINEAWLQGLTGQTPQYLPHSADASVEQIADQSRPGVDWGNALAVPSFYGREQELAQISRWIVEERCRVVSVPGLGGIGKSALTVTLMHQVAAHFQVVIWRSLRDTPSCEAFLDTCLDVFAPTVFRKDLSALKNVSRC